MTNRLAALFRNESSVHVVPQLVTATSEGTVRSVGYNGQSIRLAKLGGQRSNPSHQQSSASLALSFVALVGRHPIDRGPARIRSKRRGGADLYPDDGGGGPERLEVWRGS
jgi:hypothetical protein